MDIISLDFETYYDQQFSLSKITTEEYIRSPLFQTIGVGVKVNEEETLWYTGDDAGVSSFLGNFDWDNSALLAHNALFDAAILSWRYNIKPKAILDTLSMARAIHGTEVGNSLAKLALFYELGVKGTEVVDARGKRIEDFTKEELDAYGGYCKNDVELTYGLWHKLAPKFKQSELKLIDLTIRMFSEPSLILDTNLLRQHLAEVKYRKEMLLEEAGVETRDDLMSNNKFAELLINAGVTPPMKVSPTTGKDTYAFSKTDEEFKALLEHENLQVQALVAARFGNKSTLEETRTERFMGIASRGMMPVPLQYYAAHTGRWGGADKINLQNLPSRGDNADKLKFSIRAPEGHYLIDSDSSQIEARVLAWLSGQEDLVNEFALNNTEILAGVDKNEYKHDAYKIMASAIYAKPVSEVMPNERFVGKTTILGAGYGMGAKKFGIQLKTFGVEIEESEAIHIIQTYRKTYPQIPLLWTAGRHAIEAMVKNQNTPFGNGCVEVHGEDGILLPNGLYQRYPNLRKIRTTDGEQYVYDARRGSVKIYGGKLVENICQALARCIIGEQMLRIAKRYKPVLTVHDAVACIAPKDEVEEAMAYVQECMRWTPDWAKGLPVNCEAGYGQSYGDC